MRNFFVSYRKFNPIIEGLRACGYNVIEDDWNPDDESLSDCEGYLIDIYDALKRPWDTWRLKRRLNARKIPLIGWNRDAPWNKGAKRRRLFWFRGLRVLDIYCAHSLQGASRFAHEVLYLPNAARTESYNLGESSLDEMRNREYYRHDVSFMGNLDSDKFPEFSARVEFIKKLEHRLNASGIRCWFFSGRGLDANQQSEIIRRSHININVGAACDDGPAVSWGLPERCYGVPACGGFLLSDYREHAPLDFVPGREWVSFDDLDDCMAKIQKYLANPGAARDIAEQAYRRVMHEHTYLHRAASLADAARRWRSARGVNQAPMTFPVPVRDPMTGLRVDDASTREV